MVQTQTRRKWDEEQKAQIMKEFEEAPAGSKNDVLQRYDLSGSVVYAWLRAAGKQPPKKGRKTPPPPAPGQARSAAKTRTPKPTPSKPAVLRRSARKPPDIGEVTDAPDQVTELATLRGLVRLAIEQGFLRGINLSA